GSSVAGAPVDGMSVASEARRSPRTASSAIRRQDVPSPTADGSALRRPPTIAGFAAQQALEAATASRKAAAADMAMQRRLEEAASARAAE
ncbi:unnamed protein product, partial [Ectocarpus sp. 4 AP-2014]